MNEQEQKYYKRIQLTFSVYFSITVLLLIALTAIKLKEIFTGNTQSPELERYGIILALICIPAALKIFHNLFQKIKTKPDTKRLSYYYKIIVLRLSILEIVFLFNATALYITGIKNFFYLIFVTIVSFFFCLPNKVEVASLKEDKEKEQ